MEPTNTAKQAAENPLPMLAEMMTTGVTSAIERQEAQGQQELVNSSTLPTRGLESLRGVIETAGGSIGEEVKDDALFTHVTLPEGWKKKGTDRAMHSNLLDAEGHKRASIFYKAAYYDRSADIRPSCRFKVDTYSHDVEGEVAAKLVDAKGEVKLTSDVLKVTDTTSSYQLREKAREQVEAYLNERYPDWDSPEAYWD